MGRVCANRRATFVRTELVELAAKEAVTNHSKRLGYDGALASALTRLFVKTVE